MAGTLTPCSRVFLGGKERKGEERKGKGRKGFLLCVFLSFINFNRANSTGSTSNVHIGGRNVPKASLHAVMDEPMVDTKPRSLYDILRVRRNATPTEIKTAYRSLAKRYHPDASDSKQKDDCDFIDIHNAYATLSDPTTRALYDLKLSTGFEGAARKSSEFYTCRRWETDQCW